MLSGLRRSWRAFKDAEPGDRFCDYYRRRQRERAGRAGKIVSVGLGVAFLAAGIVGLVAPGPGLLGLAFGAALIAREFAWAARALDRLELKLRAWAACAKRWWSGASLPLRGIVVTISLAGVAAFAYGAWWVAFGR